MRVWIDTDVGTDVDDALALAFALRHPELELVGASTVFGDVELRVAIVEALLERAGAAPRPVLAGLGKPLTSKRVGLMFGHEGQGLLDAAEPRTRTDADPDAEARIDALGKAIEAARPDALVAIGPMTNVGALIGAGFDLPRLAIMGSKTRETPIDGAAPHFEEWNWFCDPVAVSRMLERTLPADALPLVVPAEVTFRCRLAPGDLDQLEGGDALARTLADLSRRWLEVQRRMSFPEPGVYLHDPLTVALLAAPGLCPTESARLTISEDGHVDRAARDPNVRIAVDVDTQRARSLILDTLLGQAHA